MSTLKCDNILNSAGTKSLTVSNMVDGSAKAWVNFNGTGTVAIRTSFNVSSITDVAVGDYGVNFTTAFTDADYCSIIPTTDNGSVRTCASLNYFGSTASQARISVVTGVTNTLTDSANVYAAFFR